MNSIFEAAEETDVSTETDVVESLEALHLTQDRDSHMFGNRLGLKIPAAFYPSRHNMPTLWNIYTDRMDRFVKVLHRPTIFTYVQEFTEGLLDQFDPAVKAIFFAIALGAVVTLSDDEARSSFNETKATLISKYRLGTEQALAEAQFMTTINIQVLQAFTIYVFTLHLLKERKLAWSMTGALMRVATAARLHRDPQPQPGNVKSGQMSTFDAEARRRLWWQILLLEARNRPPQAPNLTIAPSETNVKLPMNINDDQFSSNESFEAFKNSGAGCDNSNTTTDMTFTLVRCELYQLSRLLRSSAGAGLSGLLQNYYTTQVRVKDRVLLRNSGAPDPFQAFVRALADLFFGNVELAIYTNGFKSPTAVAASRNPSQSPAGLEADLVLGAATAVLKAYHSLASTQAWQKWSCHVMGAEPWRALCIAMQQINGRAWSAAVSGAWECVEKAFKPISARCASAGKMHHKRWQTIQLLFAETKARVAKAEISSSVGVSNITPAQVSVTSGYNVSVNDGMFAPAPANLIGKFQNYSDTGSTSWASVASGAVTGQTGFGGFTGNTQPGQSWLGETEEQEQNPHVSGLGWLDADMLIDWDGWDSWDSPDIDSFL